MLPKRLHELEVLIMPEEKLIEVVHCARRQTEFLNDCRPCGVVNQEIADGRRRSGIEDAAAQRPMNANI